MKTEPNQLDDSYMMSTHGSRQPGQSLNDTWMGIDKNLSRIKKSGEPSKAGPSLAINPSLLGDSMMNSSTIGVLKLNESNVQKKMRKLLAFNSGGD